MWRRVSVLGLLGLTGFSALTAAETADDYKVTALPGLPDTELTSISQYAGHIEVSPETNGNLFFWMIEQAHKTQAEKLIIWLNGGPGCSSMDGLFLENGPYRVNPDLSLNISAGGWQDHATIVFLDQPVGTGFSFVDSMGYLRNMTQIAEEFTIFLDKFFDIFPDYQEQDMYLAGESFAGTYIPYFAARMLKINNDGEKKYNLKGMAIGNGWISPKHQYDAYYDFAVLKGLLSAEYKEYAFDELDRCHRALERGERIHVSECEQILDIIIDASVHEEDGVKYCINQYDIRMKNEKMPSCGMDWPYELEDVTKYLRTPELVAAVNAQKQELGWVECSRGVSTGLRDDASDPSYALLPDILQEIPVLLFSGDQDLICNVLGTEYLLSNMSWNGGKGLSSSNTLDWFIDDKKVGTYTEARNLTFVVVENGSHMLPYDRPIETLDMINRFMGVGNNQVNGKTSRVGAVSQNEQPVETGGNESKPPVVENEEEEEKEEEKGKKQQQQQQQQEEDENEDETVEEEPDVSSEDKWAKYYSWGTSALIVVILFAGLAGYCWYRSRQQAREGYSRPGARRGSHTAGSGLLGRLLGRGGRSKRTKLRLDDQDDTNELDELVVETPTLFAAEDYSNEERDHHHRDNNNDNKAQNIKKSPTRFAIAQEGDEEDNDDDSEGFADWEAEDSVTAKPATNPKKD